MQPDGIEILIPFADDLSRMIQTHKPVHVQAFDPKPRVEAFNAGVIDRFPWTIERPAE